MFNRKISSLILASIIGLFSCTNELNLESQIEDISILSEEGIDSIKNSKGYIGVKFNNAYKGLYEQNEKTARNDPDNPDKIFIKYVNMAKESIDIAVFDIEEEQSCNAIIKAHKRGVKVRIVTDTDGLNDKVNYSQPRQVIQDFINVGIPVIDDKRHTFMHHKFVVIDKKIVITGSLNLTVNSMFRDNNNALRISSAELADIYTKEFNLLFEQKKFGPTPERINYPEVNVHGTPIKVYFSPKGGTREAVLEELRKAQRSIKFMTFSITDNEITNILLQKDLKGIKVEGIFDGCMLSKYSAYLTLLKKEMPVYIDGNQALLHNKVFLIDNETIITGSYNFSKNAEENNNENTLIIKSKELANEYSKEFTRLRNASFKNKNLPPYKNRTCGSKDNGNDDK